MAKIDWWQYPRDFNDPLEVFGDDDQSADAISALGAAWEVLERVCGQVDDERDGKGTADFVGDPFDDAAIAPLFTKRADIALTYRHAVEESHWPAIRAAHLGRIPYRDEVGTLLDDCNEKSAHHKMLEALGPQFSTARERFDATMAKRLAWKLYDIALLKNHATNYRELFGRRTKHLSLIHI